MEKKESVIKLKSVSEKFIDQFYAITTVFRNEIGEEIDIPEEGFLGLLATGYRGLSAIRRKNGNAYLYLKFTKGKKMPGRIAAKKSKTNL